MTASSDGKRATKSTVRQPNDRSPSTTWVQKTVKVRRRPDGQQAQPPGGRRWRRLPERRMRAGITLRIHLRGGAECWVEVEARGSMGRYHGSTSIYDVLQEVCNAQRR